MVAACVSAWWPLSYLAALAAVTVAIGLAELRFWVGAAALAAFLAAFVAAAWRWS